MNPLTNFVKHSWKRPLNGHAAILQVDGGDGEQLKEEDHFSFLSEYGEEDILFSLEEVFPPEKIATMMSRVRVAPSSADHLCNVTLRPVQGKKTTWSVLEESRKNKNRVSTPLTFRVVFLP